MSVLVQINEQVAIREFKNDKGKMIKYIAGWGKASAKPNAVLRAMVETGITAQEMLNMVAPEKEEKIIMPTKAYGAEYKNGKGTKNQGKKVGKASSIQPVIDRLKTLNEGSQIIMLSRLTREQARAVDLNLRGKIGSNSGPKMSEVKVMETILNSLSLEYQVTPDLEFIKTGLDSELYDHDALFQGL